MGSGFQIGNPEAESMFGAIYLCDHRPCTVDEQPTQIFISLFTNSQQLRLSPGGDLSGNKTEPCCKLSAFGECSAVSDCRHHRRSRERPDAGHSQEAFARRICISDSIDLTIELIDVGLD